MSHQRQTYPKGSNRDRHFIQKGSRHESAYESSTPETLSLNFDEIAPIKDEINHPTFNGLTKDEAFKIRENMEEVYREKVKGIDTEGLPVDLNDKSEVINKCKETFKENQKVVKDLERNYDRRIDVRIYEAPEKSIQILTSKKQEIQGEISNFLNEYSQVLAAENTTEIKSAFKKSIKDWEETLGHAISEGTTVKEILGELN